MALGLELPAFAQTCPDLSSYYPRAQNSAGDPAAIAWPALQQQLNVLLPACLNSSEYFALLGAAQLNNGSVADALESLERALLLAPDNGAAQIDYAQALFQQGQLFSALELNQQLLARQDLPSGLSQVLEQRQQTWTGMTRQHGFNADFLVGYDTNLNGAPAPGQITLTLSGDSVILPLNPEFRPINGPYMNVRVGGRYRQLAPQHQHNLMVELRGRVSQDKESDLLQLDSRYAFIRPGREHSWQATAGINHLYFGGSPLYTAIEASGRYLRGAQSTCNPFANVAAQYQIYHDRSALNAVEGKAGTGVNCPVENRLGQQVLSAEVSLLTNRPIESGRPGGSRNGWQVNLDWLLQLPRGTLSAQVNHTELDDTRGYSSLLENGAERWLTRSFMLVQYKRQLRTNTILLINAYHQEQRSNIELFQSDDSTLEIGLSFSF